MSNELRAYGDDLVRMAQEDPEMIRGHSLQVLSAIAIADFAGPGIMDRIISSLKKLEDADIVYRDPRHVAEASRNAAIDDRGSSGSETHGA